jgi:hypothetical protein
MEKPKKPRNGNGWVFGFLPSSAPMDKKLEQFLQKSGFANTHISEKVHLGFFKNLAKNYFNIWTIISRF